MSDERRMRVVGELVHEAIGVGVWVLVTASGDRHTLYGDVLYGDVPSGLVGQRVRVEGEAGEVMGVGMVGDAPPINVSRIVPFSLSEPGPSETSASDRRNGR